MPAAPRPEAPLAVAAAGRAMAGAMRLRRLVRLCGSCLVLRAPLGVCVRARAFFRLSRAYLGDPLGVRDLQTLGAGVVVEIGHRHAGQAPTDGALDAAQIALFLR